MFSPEPEEARVGGLDEAGDGTFETASSAVRHEGYWTGEEPPVEAALATATNPTQSAVRPLTSNAEATHHVRPTHPSGPRHLTLGEKLSCVVKNPAVIAGIGSTIVTMKVNPIISGVFGFITLATAINTVRHATNNESVHTENEDVPTSRRSGVEGLIKEIVGSPGLFSVAQATAYAITSTLMVQAHDWYRAAVFACFTIGSFAVARLCNKDAVFKPRDKLAPEKLIEKVWEKTPAGVKDVVNNPGVSFPAGNLALLLHDTNLRELLHNRVGIGLFAGGCLLATYAIVNGLKPLFRPTGETSGLSSTVSGAGDIVTGVSSMFGGYNNTALATIVWGISNIAAGRKINQQQVENAQPESA